jgi:hypothetical protein
MLLVIALHAVLCAATAVATPKLGPKAFLLAALGPLSGVVLLAASAADVLAGRVWRSDVAWVPGLDLALSLRLDGLSWVMLVLVSGIGAAIFVFCAWYAPRDATLTRFVATLTAFAGAMVGLVLADDVLLLYVFWELTSVTSFLLVGLKTDDPASRRAALQALLITMLGGLAMLVGLLILAWKGGSSQLSALVADPRAAAARGADQIGTGAVSHLVAGGDGRTHPGQRLPARRGDGQGRDLPARPAVARVRRGGRLVAAAAGGRRGGHDAGRWLAGTAPARPETAAGVLHRRPVGHAHGGSRLGQPGLAGGDRGAADRARSGEGRPVLFAGRPRPPGRHP